MPTGPEAYRVLKEARGVYGHELNLAWRTVGPMVCDLLDALELDWTTIDGVRFLTKTEKPTVGPVVIWIGEFNIDDVELEFRESLYHRSAGPTLLKSVWFLDKTVDVRGPLTTALGLSISPADQPNTQGTMAVYFAEGSSSTKTLGLTCRHVVLEADNDDYTFTTGGAPPKYVQLLGTPGFDALLESIRLRIDHHRFMVDFHEDNIQLLERQVKGKDEDDVTEAEKHLKKVRFQLEDTHEAIEDLEKFCATVQTDWSSPEQRIIGHIRRSPPLLFGVQPGGFTQDWAAIELDGPKFSEFKGNFIDLGTGVKPYPFMQKMYFRDDGRPSFEYPHDRLLPIRDMVTEQLMRAPDMLDKNDAPCLLMIKSGTATGVTIGRATGIESFIRDPETGQRSTAWAVYNYDSKPENGTFSAKGDSGSMVVDGLGRMYGMIIGGAGKSEPSDVTYVTPMCKLWPLVKAEFPDAHPDPGTMA